MLTMDPFDILGPEPEEPITWDEAAHRAVEKLRRSVERFEELYPRVPAERFTPEEWRVVELAAQDVEEAVERAEEGYIAVQYDRHAWYRIMESLERVHLRLESAIGILERALDREP